jgi:integrase
MSERFNFTKATLEALPAAEPGQRVRYYDTKVGGLTLRVGPPEPANPAGRRIFYFYKKVAGRVIQSKIGPFPDLPLDVARMKAIEANAAAATQQDPVKAIGRHRTGLTVRQLFDWWLEHYAKERRKTWQEDQKVFDRYFKAIAGRPAASVTKTQMRELHRAIAKDIADTARREAEKLTPGKVDESRLPDGHVTANRACEMIRAVYNRAIKWDVFDGPNPCLGIDWFPEQSRERVLMEHEVASFFAALDSQTNPDFRDYVLISLFTGARQGNVLTMRWDEIDLRARTWAIPMTKNGKGQVVPLEDQEIAILADRRTRVDGPWVFPGHHRGTKGHLVEPKRPWGQLLDAAGIKDLHIHDLRRTLGSWMADTGAPLNVIGKALGHESPSATAIYARLSPKPVRQAKVLAIAELRRVRAR